MSDIYGFVLVSWCMVVMKVGLVCLMIVLCVMMWLFVLSSSNMLEWLKLLFGSGWYCMLSRVVMECVLFGVVCVSVY